MNEKHKRVDLLNNIPQTFKAVDDYFTIAPHSTNNLKYLKLQKNFNSNW